MSMKRTDESFNEERTTKSSDETFLHADDAKRGRFTTVSDTMFNDLPTELLEYILVEAISMEVKDTKLAKSAWTEKADLVIGKLKTVCSLWSCILSTQSFRNQLHRTLDGIALKPIHTKLLHQLRIQFFVYAVTAMKDEIFLLCKANGKRSGHEYVINVCDRNRMGDVMNVIWIRGLDDCWSDFYSYLCRSVAIDLTVKDVIRLPGIASVECIAACSVLDCLYVLTHESGGNFSVLRITKDEERQFNISTWITDLRYLLPILSVSAQGSLAIASHDGGFASEVSIYSANGFLQNRIALTDDIHGYISFRYFNVLQQPKGNLVLVWETFHGGRKLTEIDPRGSILRQYDSGLGFKSDSHIADIYGRIWIMDDNNRIEIVDAELNPLEFAGPPLDKIGIFPLPLKVCFNSDRNEIVRISYCSEYQNTVLTVFRFSEERPFWINCC